LARPDVAKNYYLSSYHQASESFEFVFNRDFLRRPGSRSPGNPALRRGGLGHGQHDDGAQQLLGRPPTPPNELGVTVRRTSQEILDGQIAAWDTLITQLEQDEFMKRVMDSQRAWVERVSYYELMNAPDYVLAYNHYFPGKLAL
jgi:TRAP-type mannitol/chloroaromatic compound transport system substrate-binding protein